MAPTSSVRHVSPCSCTYSREHSHRRKRTVKNGSVLAGYGTLMMKNALANTMPTLTVQLVQSLNWDA
ncbi:hypothetical protein NJB1604_51180 [Mycobacterium marinum]|nr:hypothetical protein NJB1604_51180 [Mycobacterium marinum]